MVKAKFSISNDENRQDLINTQEELRDILVTLRTLLSYRHTTWSDECNHTKEEARREDVQL